MPRSSLLLATLRINISLMRFVEVLSGDVQFETRNRVART